MNFSLEYPIVGEKLPEDLKILCEFICELNEELAKIPLPKSSNDSNRYNFKQIAQNAVIETFMFNGFYIEGFNYEYV